VLEQIAINLATMVLGVTVGTYLGAKIMKHELTRELSRYIKNELPHILESEQFRVKARENGTLSHKRTMEHNYGRVTKMKCPHCGSQVDIEWEKCQVCGYPLYSPQLWWKVVATHPLT